MNNKIKELLIENNCDNPYFLYIAANQANEFFKHKIKKNDLQHEFYRVNEKIEVSTDRINSYKEENFKPELEAIENEKKNWRDKHLSYYRIQKCLPSISVDIVPLSISLNDVINFKDINMYIQGYKASSEILKGIDNSSLDKYCIDSKTILNYEHKDEYNSFIKELNEKYKIPSNEEITFILEPKTELKYRLCLDRSKCSNFDYYNHYIKLIKDKIIEA